MPHTPLHGLLDAFIPAAEGSTGPQWAFEQEHNMKDYFKMLREKEKRENLLSSNIPEPANIDRIYDAISEAEHEGTQGSRWIKSEVEGSTAWGEVQINTPTMETARDTPGLLNSKEWHFANRFIMIPAQERKDWLVGPYEKKMYRTITKKLMQKYLDESGGNPLWVMLKWKMGPNATSVLNDPKASRSLADVMERMRREDSRYLRVFMEALGLTE